MAYPIWIDIEDASGVKQSDGPITTATNWTSTRRMDAAGTFTFTMPASDPRASDLAHKRIVRCWTYDANGLKELGAGIIDRITVQPQADGPTMIEVTGDDLLRELANRTVGDLALQRDAEYTTATAWPNRVELWKTGGDPSVAIALGDPVDLSVVPLLFFQVELPQRQYVKISLEFSVTNTVESENRTFQAQYYNGESAAWEAVPDLVNDTTYEEADPDPSQPKHMYPFYKNGDITFSPPPGWGALGSGNYALRFFDPETNLGEFRVSAVSVTIVEPVTDGLQRIMALAPDGWALDPTGYFGTVDAGGSAVSVYMDFAGESVLAALILLAEQTGNHFVLSPAFRRLKWLGMAKQASGLRAVQASETTANTMLIASLARTSDSYELYNRAYAYGGGVGSGRLTLASTTRSAPSGYTLNKTSSYLQHNTSSAAYGRIDKREDHPDLVPADASNAQIINAANALFDRVYHALRRKAEVQYAYDVTIIPTTHEVWPGQTIQVVYHEWVESYHAVNIDAALWVLEATQQVDASGVRTVEFVVATIDYWPDNDYRTVSNLMGKVEVERSVDTPATGYTSNAAGVPVNIGIQNGQIVSVARVIPISDGVYPSDPLNYNIDSIVIRNGLIAAITETHV